MSRRDPILFGVASMSSASKAPWWTITREDDITRDPSTTTFGRLSRSLMFLFTYLHPTMPPSTMADWYQGSYSSQPSMAMSHFAFGWHFDTAIHVLRLYAAGAFARFPNLKILLGHFGESLPFFLERVQWFSANWGPINPSFQQVYAENFWFTTNLLKGVAPLACMLQNTKLDRIMVGIDYPFLRMQDGVEWIEQVRASGLLKEQELEMILYRNGESFLNIK
ncbi:uncharacterized protein NECHADRAFT_87313 [Fusarium vanettenii 77-13-4]|uniref:Amidohydrolase-related domain-containing protein n=1 Tax=Fusarium vanettenii (strain ATCC MYA-4622 / CBS 123669 / FGSC 9596 / NRRL 45880 / 77-13-4) TaxID=660122 RepID=C7ZL92_FUSV7|nr:uncharacterized protein NECHADRAFT_87313 [Fusarium vanettenii 77-13-4]EEU35192.1 hypothetical protein NECHADRAFT_87313 [Fusarium vanettenii 77-13-4]